jgi:hypothetical protein
MGQPKVGYRVWGIRLYGVMNENQKAANPVKQELTESQRQWAEASQVLGYGALIFGTLIFLWVLAVGRYPWGSAWAVVTLICMLISFLAGWAAVLCGYAARIKRPPESLTVSTAMRYGVAGMLIALTALFILPFIVPAHAHHSMNACVNNLRQIDGAKEQWALENKMTLTDTPSMSDLVGSDKYIKVAPSCPLKGAYTIGDMSTKPKCSITDHTLQ